jgi:hypothetical protein
VRWGTLDGTVTSVSGDVTARGLPGLGGASAACFSVTIRPAATALRLPDGRRAGLRKGLTVRARFLVTRCSILRYLCDDLRSRFDPVPASVPGSV